MRASPCKWVLWEPDGRPWCEHGRAVACGTSWRCRAKKYESARRWRQTDAGREAVRRDNASPSKQSSKRLYDLTRIRPGG